MANEKPPTTASTRPVWGSMAMRPPPTSGICISDQAPARLALILGRDVDHVAGSQDVGDGLGLGALAEHLGPLHLVERELDGMTLCGELAVLLARRLQADDGLGLLGRKHDAEAPGRDVGRAVDRAERHAPVAGDVDLGHRPAPALLAVEVDEAIDQRLAADLLQLGIERRADRKAAGVELGLAVLGQERAADLLGEIFGREDMRAARAEVDGERLLPWLPRLPRSVM